MIELYIYTIKVYLKLPFSSGGEEALKHQLSPLVKRVRKCKSSYCADEPGSESEKSANSQLYSMAELDLRAAVFVASCETNPVLHCS